MNPILVLLLGAVALLVLSAAIIFRRRDPVLEREVAEEERKQRIKAQVADRREFRSFLATVGVVLFVVLVAWIYLGFPKTGADAINAIKSVITPPK